MVRQTKEELGKNGLAPELDVKTAQVQAEELAKENDLAQKEVSTFEGSIKRSLPCSSRKWTRCALCTN